MRAVARWFVVGQVLGVLAAAAPSCQGAPCGPTTCFGCCTADDLCVGGNEETACGQSGGACAVCSAGELCTGNVCLATLAAEVDAGASEDAGVTAPTNPLIFTATITPDPARLGRNVLMVTIAGTNGVRVDQASLRVDVYMPTHGHGSPEAPIVTAKGNGVYQVDRVTFSMQGQWRVTLTGSAAGGLAGSQVLFFNVS